MGGACSTYGTRDLQTKFCSGILKGRDHSRDLGVDGRVILESVLEN